LTLALAAGVVALSCGSGPKGGNLAEPYRISFDLSSIDRNAPFPTMSEMIGDIEYVKLEYVDSIPVGGIAGKPVITDEYIVFCDRHQGVLQYSREGKFVRRIGHKGRGPGEYGDLAAISLDKKRGIIHTFPLWGGNETNKYDLATGRFIEQATITTEDGQPLRGYEIFGMESLSDDVVLLHQGRMKQVHFGPNRMTVYSYRTLDLPSAQITHSEKSRHYADVSLDEWVIRYSTSWRDPEGRVNLYENLADTMFVVGADGSATPRIIPDFGSHKLESSAPGARGVEVNRIRESERYILFEVELNYESYMISFDKATGERSVAVFPEEGLFAGPANDIDGGFSQFKPYDEHTWWASFNAFDMVTRLNREHFEKVRPTIKYPYRLEKLKNLVASLTEDDNPVIVVATLKK
jgi:hypothetical protein